METKKYQVFISSTFTDLVEERTNIIKAVLELYHIPIGMEMFSAEDEDQWEIIRRTIDLSDYYILILGLRYGTTDKNGISFTEKEYDYAIDKGIPVLSFLCNEDIPLAMNKRDDNLTNINKFRKKVFGNSKMSKKWNNNFELVNQVSISLTKQINSRPGIGWIRGNNFKYKDELIEALQENKILKKELENLRKNFKTRKPVLNIDFKNLLIDEDFDNFQKIKLPKSICHSEIDNFRFEITKQDIDIYNDALPSQEVVDNYNKDFEVYYKSKNYGSSIDITVSNTGDSAASDIYIDIILPENLLILDSNAVLEEPTSPIPEHPELSAMRKYNKRYLTMGTAMQDIISRGLSTRIYDSDVIANFRDIQIDECIYFDDGKISIKIKKLLHSRSFKFSDRYKIIPLRAGTFKIEIIAMCEDYSKPDHFDLEIQTVKL